MLSRDAVRDAVVEGWNNYYRRQTRQLQEHAHFFDDQADAIMALLPDAEALGRAARRAAADLDCTGATPAEWYQAILDALRKEREG